MPSRATARKTKPMTVAEALRANGVVMEQLKSQMAMVLEAVTLMKTELKAAIASLDSRLSARLSVLEEAVRESTAQIRKNSEDIRKITAA